MKSINLILGGSGTAFPVYVGAVAALEDHGVNIESVIGTSGGALIGSLICAGKDSEFMKQVLKELDLMPLLDFDPFFWKKYHWGVFKGNKIEAKLKEICPGNLGSLKKNMTIVTSNLSKQRIDYYNNISHPDMFISKAIRHSISLPGIFSVCQNKEGDILVDGGVLSNFPVDFPIGGSSLGIRVKTSSWKIGPINTIVDYISAVFNSMLRIQEAEQVEDAPDRPIIYIDTHQPTVNLALNQKDIDLMIQEGYSTTYKFCQKLYCN